MRECFRFSSVAIPLPAELWQACWPQLRDHWGQLRFGVLGGIDFVYRCSLRKNRPTKLHLRTQNLNTVAFWSAQGLLFRQRVCLTREHFLELVQSAEREQLVSLVAFLRPMIDAAEAGQSAVLRLNEKDYVVSWVLCVPILGSIEGRSLLFQLRNPSADGSGELVPLEWSELPLPCDTSSIDWQLEANYLRCVEQEQGTDRVASSAQGVASKLLKEARKRDLNVDRSYNLESPYLAVVMQAECAPSLPLEELMYASLNAHSHRALNNSNQQYTEWINELRRPSLRRNWSKICRDPVQYFWLCLQLYAAVAHASRDGLSSPQAFRDHYVDYLCQLADVVHEPELARIALSFRQVGQQWSVLSLSLLIEESTALSKAISHLDAQAEALHSGSRIDELDVTSSISLGMLEDTILLDFANEFASECGHEHAEDIVERSFLFAEHRPAFEPALSSKAELAQSQMVSRIKFLSNVVERIAALERAAFLSLSDLVEEKL